VNRAAEARIGADSLAFLAGGGDMGARIRAYDWARTPLGPPSRWPQTLRTSLRVLLTTNHPIFVFWGPELVCFYNDAYRQSLGPEKHPSILGAHGREAWDEIWDIIGPQIEQVMHGRGATWHENQRLPRAHASAAAGTSDRAADAPPRKAVPPLRLMVVDDNKDAADMLAMLLQIEGHEVSVEHDAQAAFARALSERPPVMLLDIGLPFMDGFELARRLRADPATASSTLIALTGYGRDDDRLRSREAGFDHHLVKPVDPKELTALLAALAVGR
jgi:CheY-like chemotaxis protein